MKRILISNDDGYMATGLGCLATHLARTAEITVVAPDRDRSGASNSLTLLRPLRVSRAANGFFFVDGTPTDCVHVAITGLLQHEPDMVIAGINHGGNLGDDVLYSGTVAAAMEGRFLGLPAIAVSLAAANPVHFSTAAAVIEHLLEALTPETLPADTVLNVNVPDVAYADLRGFEATRLGHRHKSEPVIAAHDPRGRPIYWVGPPGSAEDAGPGTDFHAIAAGYVSVTPIHADLTRHNALDALKVWCRETL
ncbi:5'/3'-nucleotidase SurE [Acidiferrobacter sp.]|uniref:5'/3'-nucleotidase SurE n=1 Tax=Acidiferrobacter sp. TaxID=1872107 RepID=UPI002633B206|nr:5'/3'-nucleotidase SurE [Acidiferrobacter sp.]